MSEKKQKFAIPLHIIDKLSSKYRASSINTITNGVKRVSKGLGKSIYDRNTLEDYSKVKAYLDTLPKESVKRALVHNVMVVLEKDGTSQDIIEKYKLLHKQYAKSYKNEYTWQSADADKFISLQDLATKMVEIGNKSKKYNDILKYVVLALYVYMPALRGEDYYSMLKKEHAIQLPTQQLKNTNYIEMFGSTLIPQFVINKYKTSETHGTRKLKIPSELATVLEIWFQVNKDSKYLLAKADGKPLGPSEFTMLLNRAIGKKISSSDLRKIYIAEMLNFFNNLPDTNSIDKIKWRKIIAEIMAHTVEMQEFVYSGFRNDSKIQYSSHPFMEKVFDRLQICCQTSI